MIAVLVVVSASLVLVLAQVSGFVVGWRRRRRAGPIDPRGAPLVSVLKPLAGRDDDLEDNLESFARLAYPRFELLLGVASLDDEAVPAARAFLRAHPGMEARLVVTDPDAALNPKVAQLIGLEAVARGDVLWISDSNTRVSPDILDTLVAELRVPGTGMASSIVSGVGEETLGASLENLQMSAQIAASVLGTWAFLGKALTVGKSMAMWRHALRSVGGFAPVRDLLAEDHTLGKIFHEAGWGVRIAPFPVENRNRRCGLARTAERHTRWARMRRTVCPLGFAFEPLLSPVVVASLALLLVPGPLAAALLGVAVLVQVTGALVVLRLLRGAAPPLAFVPLELVRGFVLLGCWLAGVASRRISWRGHPFVLGPGSVLRPLHDEGPEGFPSGASG